MNKKLLLGLGSIATITLPVVAVVSCSDSGTPAEVKLTKVAVELGTVTNSKYPAKLIIEGENLPQDASKYTIKFKGASETSFGNAISGWTLDKSSTATKVVLTNNFDASVTQNEVQVTVEGKELKGVIASQATLVEATNAEVLAAVVEELNKIGNVAAATADAGNTKPSQLDDAKIKAAITERKINEVWTNAATALKAKNKTIPSGLSATSLVFDKVGADTTDTTAKINVKIASENPIELTNLKITGLKSEVAALI